MASRTFDHWNRLSPEQRAQLDDRIEAFERAWRRGRRPGIAAHLPADSGLRVPLLVELVQIDIEFRFKAGEMIRIDLYRGEFPELPEQADLRPEVMPLIPGYAPVRLLGRGRMGSVYESVHKASGEPLAVKVLSGVHAPSDPATQLFLREADVLSQLDHPSIVRLREVGWTHELLFIAMGLVKQIDFQAVLSKRSIAKRIRLVCGVVAQVLDALEAAHRLKIVHGDVKPTNVLVTKTAMTLAAKLTDFGLAKSFGTAGSGAIPCEEDARGTLGFMAPEQLADSRSVKPSADIYSVGVTLFFLLTGRLPFASAAVPATVPKALDARPALIKELIPEAPEGLSEIVLRALAPEPAMRFSCAEEMKTALLPFGSLHLD
jgi:serine/threonine protein kinase